MKKFLLFTCAILFTIQAMAQTYTEGQAIFKVTGTSPNTVEFSMKSCTVPYEDTLISIPEEVTFEGVTYTVTSIAYAAFDTYQFVKKIEIPNSVTKIGARAFQFCYDLESVILPNSVTDIGEGLFYACKSLKSVILPDSLTEIKKEMFQLCESLISIDIPNTVKTIGNNAFFGCKNLLYIKFPESVTKINQSAFWNCSNLQSISLPNTLERIGLGAFKDCPNLSFVFIPKSVTYVDGEAFGDSITIFCEHEEPQRMWWSTWTLSNNIVWDISNPFTIDGLKYTITDATHVSVGCDSTLTDTIVIPEKVTYKDMEFTVNAIMDEGFINQFKLKSVVIPESVTKIGEKAFYENHNIISLDIPSSVSSIGASAFTTILNVAYAGNAEGGPWGANVLNGEVDYDLKYVFSDSTRTKIVRCFGHDSIIVIPNTVKELGRNSFAKIIELKSVDLNNVEKIGDKAFTYTGLQEISLSNKIKYIGERAFFNTYIKKILLPSSVDTMGSSAFSITDTVYCRWTTVPVGKHYHRAWNYKVNTVIYNCKLLNVSVANSDSSTVEVSGHVGIDEEGAYWYADSTTANIKAIPGKGYDVQGEVEQSFVMRADTSITVSFVKLPTYTITYMVDDEVYHRDTIVFGDSIVPAKKPTKEGYSFSGWKNLPATMPAENVTATGSFKVKSYVLTYKVDGNVYQQDTIAFGESIVAIEAPTKDNYRFVEWKNLPSTMPAKNITVSAIYEEISGVSLQANNATLVWAEDGQIFIHTEAETPYRVYNMLGQQKAYGMTEKDETRIVMSQKGSYIVLLKDQKYKVIIR